MGENRERKGITDSDPLFKDTDSSVLEGFLDEAEKFIEEFSALKRRVRNELDKRRIKKAN